MPHLDPAHYCVRMSDRVSRGSEARKSTQRVSTSGCAPFNSAAGQQLDLTVIFTTVRGTAAALNLAGSLAHDLDARVTLVVPQVVPYRIPLNCPPIDLGHTRRMMLSLIADSPARGLDVAIQICLCRDRKLCLNCFVTPNSVVLVGGRGSWWGRRERGLARFMRSRGHEVIFVDSRERHDA